MDMVMVSSAHYDQDRPASSGPRSHRWSRADLLREDLGFSGVVISDDLAAAAMEDVDPAQRALHFVAAGGDLLIIGDPALVGRMARAVRQRMADDESFAERVRASATRVVALKARRGLVECRATR